MKHKEVEAYILAKPGSFLGYPFGEEVAVYKVGSKETASSTGSPQGKMFALIPEDKDPVNLSLKCDPILAQKLREKYETIMPGYHLSKKHWNTIVLSGQLSEDEIHGFIDHSYQLVVEGLSKEEQGKLVSSG
jgi:predicted DNA-binding protein (MmcQ/YjbR family)